MERYDFTLSAEVRDNIIFGSPIKWEEQFGGIKHFHHMEISTLKQLNDMGYIDLDSCQNSSPSIGEFMVFMEEHPNVTCHGYVVSPYRQDYRISVEGLECLKDIENVRSDFEEFSWADEYVVSDESLYCWWD